MGSSSFFKYTKRAVFKASSRIQQPASYLVTKHSYKPFQHYARFPLGCIIFQYTRNAVFRYLLVDRSVLRKSLVKRVKLGLALHCKTSRKTILGRTPGAIKHKLLAPGMVCKLRNSFFLVKHQLFFGGYWQSLAESNLLNPWLNASDFLPPTSQTFGSGSPFFRTATPRCRKSPLEITVLGICAFGSVRYMTTTAASAAKLSHSLGSTQPEL